MGTVTARISDSTAAKLEAIAKAANRSKSFLVAAALERFVEEQEWQVARIAESLAQADRGEFATDAEVKAAFAAWGADVDPSK